MRPVKSIFTRLVIRCFLVGGVTLFYGHISASTNEEIQQQMETLLVDGQLAEASRLNEQYMINFQQTGDSTLLAYYLSNQAAIDYYLGNFTSALRNWEHYLPLIDTVAKPFLKGRILSNICECHRQLFNYAQSYSYCLKALREMDKHGDTEGRISTLSLIVQHWLAMEQPDTAAQLAKQSLSLAISNNLPFAIAEANQMMAKVAAYRGQHKEAIKHLEAAAARYDSLGFQHGTASCLLDIAQNYLYQQQPYAAAQAAQEALTIAHQINVPDYANRASLQLAEAYMQLNLPHQATVWLDSVNMETSEQDHNLMLDYYRLSKELAWNIGDSLKGYQSYRQYIMLRDSIQRHEKREALQSLIIAYDKESDIKTINTLTSRLNWIRSGIGLVILLVLVIIIGSSILVLHYRNRWKNLQSYRMQLEKEVSLLRSQQVIGLLPSDEAVSCNQLCRQKLESYLQSPLNDTAWNILLALTEDPNLSNPQLARKMRLSYEGLRSSLKKMYRLFQIDESVSNKRVALLAAVVTANNRIVPPQEDVL